MGARIKSVPKRPRGRPRTGINAMIAIRWPPDLIEAIDAYGECEGLARPAALRQIVSQFLEAYANTRVISRSRGRREAAE